ncbi:MAG: YqgE/AlgH family protein [Chitinophagales bacterium]|nr:YqgE/AlgH family protein [Chitinophagales bacterium]
MDFLDLHKLTRTELLAAGKLLIAQPFLKDTTFARSVIFLCEHSAEGALGFILNHPMNVNIGDLLPDIYAPDLFVNQGGPVQLDTLHVLHRIPGDIGGTEVNKGVYWGASFDMLQTMFTSPSYPESDIRLFVGYAGWSPGQLENEMEEGSWLVADTSADIMFDTEPEKIWQRAIYSLGKDYRYLANMPADPGLN